MSKVRTPGDRNPTAMATSAGTWPAVPGVGLVPLESVVCTEELSRRPSRPPDYETENLALGKVAQALAGSPDEVLQKMADILLETLQADSAGFSVLTEDGKAFHWPAIAGRWKPHIGGGTPRDLGPCGDVLDRGAPMLFAHPERRYTYLAPLSPAMVECLLIPFHVNGRAAGTIWVASHGESRPPSRPPFDAEDLRQLVSMAGYASVAHQAMARGLERRDAALELDSARLANSAVEREQAKAAPAARRAALNLMEDAVLARQSVERANQSLRESEAKLARELAATQQLQTVSAQLIEGGNIDALYQNIVDAAVAIMRSDMGSMQIVDEDEDALRLLAWRGFDPDFGRIFGLNRPERPTSCSAARRLGRRVMVPDVETCDFLVGTPALEDHRKTGIRAVQSTPLFSRAGRLVGMISTHWRTPHTPTETDLHPFDVLAREAADLIERKGAEESIARLAAIVASSDDAIIGMNLDGVIGSWNTGAERLFGYAADEVIGKSVTLLIPPDRVDEETTILERVRRGERVEHFETVRRRKHGNLLHISLTISPIEDAAGHIVGASKIARDITGRKLAQDALKEADRRKNEFLAMLAHELRGPLAPIRNSLQIVRLRSGDAAAVASASAMMERQVRQMARLIDDLIDVSRISRGKLELRRESTELISLLRSVAEATLPTFEGMHQELTVTLPQQPIYVNADPTRLAQVVGNLLNNACKFTDKGGRIGLIAEREGDQAVIRIRDTGIGIASENLPGVFDMFSQVDGSLERSRGGLGIGLSLVRNVVEMHGGEVAVHSDGLGQGSEFVVRLPILVEPTNLPEPQPTSAPQTKAGLRILVVDDNWDSANSLAMLLELQGHDVRTAHDGLAAVVEAATFQPVLILLDLGLPKLNGFEAARRIRKQPGGREVKIVALSGWGQEEDRRRATEAGFDDHFVKPVAPESLDRLLATVGGQSGESDR